MQLLNSLGSKSSVPLPAPIINERPDNADTAEAIMQYMKKGERAGYFRIAAIRERPE